MTTITVKVESICRYILCELPPALLKFIKRYMKDFIIRGTTIEFCSSGIFKGIETFTETLVPVIQRVSTDDRVFPTCHIVYQAKMLPMAKSCHLILILQRCESLPLRIPIAEPAPEIHDKRIV